jgi:hypothetical protein
VFPALSSGEKLVFDKKTASARSQTRPPGISLLFPFFAAFRPLLFLPQKIFTINPVFPQLKRRQPQSSKIPEFIRR